VHGQLPIGDTLKHSIKGASGPPDGRGHAPTAPTRVSFAEVIAAIRTRGFACFVVGGYARDLIQNHAAVVTFYFTIFPKR
jgi:hypothetical protein